MPPLFSILIPTWNNPTYFDPCIESIARTGILDGLGEVIVVNNGKQPIKDKYGYLPNLKILEPGENLGWERGLEYGLKHTTAPFVCFQNDDTFILPKDPDFYHQLLYPFEDENVAAVGPATTVASGYHSVYMPRPQTTRVQVPYLIFFTVMVRRSHLDEVGGIDTSCPGGDDFDLSLRFTKAKKKLVLNPKAFIIHHAFKTGERVRGGPGSPDGWNSQDMIDKTNIWLIQKHGFRNFFTPRVTAPKLLQEPDLRDREGETVTRFVDSLDVVELGCGFRKTVPESIGIDRVPKGEPIPHVPGGVSVADLVADVSGPLPLKPLSHEIVIARHILEHCLDPVSTLKEWNKVLKVGGKLIIAVPDQGKTNTIPMNPEHVHGYTRESLKNLLDLCGFKENGSEDPKNGVSFVSCFEKVLHMAKPEQERVLEIIHG